MNLIYYNLDKSNYKLKYKRFEFTFSSMLYLNKFNKKVDEFVEVNKQKINVRYSINLESDEIIALSLYKKIEKRGFKVKFDDKEINPNETFTISLSILNYI